jgi:glycosyltransferase involved in cell wall biosynthesis
MKLLLVHPGATFSIGDVYTGLKAALQRSPHTVYDLAMYGRIEGAGKMLKTAYRAFGKDSGLPVPTDGDVLYLASTGALERALRHDVEWVVIVTGMYWHPDVTAMLKRAGRKVAIVLTESPYDDKAQVKNIVAYDHVFCNDSGSVDFLRQGNPNVSYLPMGFDPNVHNVYRPKREDLPAHDVVFVGTGFIERVKLLEAVNWDGIDFGLYGLWPLLGSRSHLRAHINGDLVPNAQTADLYRRAKIGLQLYRTSVTLKRNCEQVTEGVSLSPRACELAACGCFTISHDRAEVREVFQGLIPTFTSATELESLIRQWLPRSEERQEIAAKLPVLVSDRSFDHMAYTLISALESRQGG